MRRFKSGPSPSIGTALRACAPATYEFLFGPSINRCIHPAYRMADVSRAVRTTERMRLCSYSKRARSPRVRAFVAGLPRSVLIVRYMLKPGHGLTLIIASLHRDVRHEAVRRCAQPVFFVWLCVDHLAGADLDGRTAATGHESDAISHVHRLALGVGVP